MGLIKDILKPKKDRMKIGHKQRYGYLCPKCKIMFVTSQSLPLKCKYCKSQLE